MSDSSHASAEDVNLKLVDALVKANLELAAARNNSSQSVAVTDSSILVRTLDASVSGHYYQAVGALSGGVVGGVIASANGPEAIPAGAIMCGVIGGTAGFFYGFSKSWQNSSSSHDPAQALVAALVIPVALQLAFGWNGILPLSSLTWWLVRDQPKR